MGRLGYAPAGGLLEAMGDYARFSGLGREGLEFRVWGLGFGV